MPLTERVYFKARLNSASANRLQIPKCVQLSYKLETDQYLKVFVNLLGVWAPFLIYSQVMGPKIKAKNIFARILFYYHSLSVMRRYVMSFSGIFSSGFILNALE
jgi:hypothetical protein